MHDEVFKALDKLGAKLPSQLTCLLPVTCSAVKERIGRTVVGNTSKVGVVIRDWLAVVVCLQ